MWRGEQQIAMALSRKVRVVKLGECIWAAAQASGHGIWGRPGLAGCAPIRCLLRLGLHTLDTLECAIQAGIQLADALRLGMHRSAQGWIKFDRHAA